MVQIKFINTVTIVLALLSLSVNNVHGADNKTISKQVSEVSAICLTSPFDCLTNVDEVLQALPPNSRMYFEVLQYKFEALLNLQKMDILYQESKQWLNKPNLPFLFQISNAIYFAKAALRMGDKAASVDSYLFAKSLLGQMNKEYPSPIRMVQFANLQMQLDEFQQAYELMLTLKKKYQNSPDSYFMLELHGNLGHAANNLGYTEAALIYWQEAVKWAKIYANKQQIAVTLFNLADIHEQLKQYPQAVEHFKQARAVALNAGDEVKANQANYHLVRVLIKQEKFCQANSLYTEVNTDILPQKPNYPFKNLTDAFAKCQPFLAEN